MYFLSNNCFVIKAMLFLLRYLVFNINNDYHLEGSNFTLSLAIYTKYSSYKSIDIMGKY